MNNGTPAKLVFLPRNRHERRALKSAGAVDMREVQLHDKPRGPR